MTWQYRLRRKDLGLTLKKDDLGVTIQESDFRQLTQDDIVRKNDLAM